MNVQQTIAESIAQSEKFIAKCKGTEVTTKYLAVFPETMMAVGMGVYGIGFTETSYSFKTALNYSRNVINGHGQNPVIMTHEEYLQKCIEQQEKHLLVMRDIATKVN